jgi:hypothetical protein
VGLHTAFALFLGLIAVDFFWLGKSLQLSNVFITGMVGSLYILQNKKLNFSEIALVFFIVGGVTSYIDVLSVPLVSLGLLLFTTIGLMKSLKLKMLILLCAVWSFGYLLLWGSKWIIAQQTYVPDAINVGYKKVQDRTSSVVDAQFSRQEAVIRNFYQLRGYDKRNKIFLLVAGLCYGTFLLRYFSIQSLNKQNAVLWISIAIIPYLWYFIAAEHSYIHVVFTYRDQFMSVVAGYLLSTEFINRKKLHTDLQPVVRWMNHLKKSLYLG